MDYEGNSLPGLVKQLAQKVILSFLKEFPGSGPKDLIIEPDLISSLDLVCGVTLLKEAGVDKIFKLEPGPSTPGSNSLCCFLTRGNVKTVRTIVDLISADESCGRKDINYAFLCIPRLTSLCEQILEEGGVLGRIAIFDCPLLLFPLDSDVISMQRSDSFNSLFLHGDKTSLYDIATAIRQVEQLTGITSSIVGQGKFAKDIIHLLECLTGEESHQEPKSREKCNASSSLLTDLLIVDRDVDMVSVLLSQLNYEGVLDETYGIDCGRVFLPPDVIPPNGVKYNLHSSDRLYGEIRDLHLSASFLRLKERGSQLRQLHSSRQEMDLTGIKLFLEKDFKNVQSLYKSLSTHVTTCEAIMREKKEVNFAQQLGVERNIISGQDMKDALTFVEDYIIRQVCLLTSLRLMSLLSLTQDGLPSKTYRSLSKLFAQSFGHEHILTFHNLKKLKLFYESTSGNILETTTSSLPNIASTISSSSQGGRTTSRHARFREVVKRLSLIPKTPEGQSYDVKRPSDEAFVFGGAFIPTVCPLLDALVMSESCSSPSSSTATISSSTSMSASDNTRLLSGGVARTLRRAGGGIVGKISSRDRTISSSTSSSSKGTTTRVVGVFFVGGVTFAEISALRFWARKKNVRLVVFSTGIVNGNSLMKGLSSISLSTGTK